MENEIQQPQTEPIDAPTIQNAASEVSALVEQPPTSEQNASEQTAAPAEEHVEPIVENLAEDKRSPLTTSYLAPAINEIVNFAAQRGYTTHVTVGERGHVVGISFA